MTAMTGRGYFGPAACLAWLGHLLFHLIRRFASFDRLGLPREQDAWREDHGGESFPLVAVILPARNEEHHLAGCVESLLAMDYPADRWSLTVVDDASTDGTAAILQGLQGRHPRLRVVTSEGPVHGWGGKCHACHLGVEQGPAEADFLCFIDADTRAEPGLLRDAVLFARRRGLGLLSLNPRQCMESFAEALLLPVGYLCFAIGLDFDRVNDGADALAAANGQFLLFTREAYQGVGGHAAVREVIHEDLMLARRIKEQGWPMLFLRGDGRISVRMYRTAEEIWWGFGKNARQILGGRWQTMAAVLTLLLSALAPIGVVAGDSLARPWRWAARIWTLVTGIAYAATAWVLRAPPWAALLFPVAHLFWVALLVGALLGVGPGRPRWKGRFFGEQP